MPYTVLSNKSFRSNNVLLALPEALLYYLALHVKLASSARASQLVEIFAYENPTSSTINMGDPKTANAIAVYQFHNTFSQERLFVFTTSLGNSPAMPLKSITELFATAAWLEREVGEMHGIVFGGKKDLRNLMLQYGDASAPFQKSYPSIGTKEVFYDSVTDNLVQVPVTTQI